MSLAPAHLSDFLIENCLTHSYSLIIRERHLDTFGHVNNAQYQMLFEEARWDMITSRGYGLSEVQKNQIGTVVLECTLRFMKELKLRERITIETKVSKITRKTLTIHHRIQNENGESAAESEFKMGCFDLKKRRLLSPTENWMQALTGIQR